MTYIEINNNRYPAIITGSLKDTKFGNRDTKSIKLTMPFADAIELFVDDVPWSIISEEYDEEGNIVEVVYDNSEYCMAGDITDHRNGTITVKMAKLTAEDILKILTGEV